MKVLFVCLGNICRSPLAEAVFKHKIQSEEFGKNVLADSCGTSNYHIGDLPDERTRKNAAKNGVEMSHRGRQISAIDLKEFDYILAMDRSNYHNILNLPGADSYHHKVLLMRSFDPEEGDEVPDPYYGSEEDFQEVFDILDRAVDGFINRIRMELL
ncbi:MAG: low molecular weight protein-tyrosine-phosphatase [Cyclobacteriaceae bacterium]